MLRGLLYPVVLLVFTGSVCVANPLQFRNDYSSNMAGFGGYNEILREEKLSEILEECPDDPVVKIKMRKAVEDSDICIRQKFEDAFASEEYPRWMGKSEQFKSVSKVLCRIFKDVQPCLRNLATSSKLCFPETQIERLMSAYRDAVSALCVNDGRKFAAAIEEMSEVPDSHCGRKIASQLERCSKQNNYYRMENATSSCRPVECLQEAVNQCGGTKTKFNELLNEWKAVMSKHFDEPCLSRSVQFCASPVLSAATLLLALFASRLGRRESLF